MNSKKFDFVITIFILLIFYRCDSVSLNTIKPDNPSFQFTGRIDFSDSLKPILFWPGTSIKTKFEGKYLMLVLDDKTGESFYNVFIDENYNDPIIIDCEAGQKSYLVSATLKDTLHSLLIFRRTEASTGPTKFLGIQLLDNKTILPPDERPKRKIVFYGNSITCGMGNEAADNANDDKMKDENNFLAYGAITSRLLNAEYMCTAKSGIGILISWFDLIMPNYYYRLNPDDENSNWDFEKFVPDVVVINLFQNDSWLIKNLNPVPDSTQIVEAYENFVKQIRAVHPKSLIICALGNMDATKAGSPWPGYIIQAVNNLRLKNDLNLETYFFPFDESWQKHPRVRHHKKMADSLSKFIKMKMNWEDENPVKIGLNNSNISPENFVLFQNYPNPFNPLTKIKYEIPKSTSPYETFHNVQLKVYDTLGKEVATLVNQALISGNYETVFDAGKYSSGVYFYNLFSEGFSITKSMVLLK
ncbi:MAG: T9SS type A sorting domain-containing protein [Ignavibacteriales bacterium]|nr:T9SS type A sorting domain-containing protein [Ignavibacteriales bacterium]